MLTHSPAVAGNRQHGAVGHGRTGPARGNAYPTRAVNNKNILILNYNNGKSTNVKCGDNTTTKVSDNIKPDVRSKDNSKVACVRVVTSIPNLSQSPNNTNPNENHLSTLKEDVTKQNEMLITNQMTNSGITTFYCTAIVKSKSEW